MVGLARSPRRRLRAGGRVAPLRFGCPPWATQLSYPWNHALSRGRCSASLRLPTLGYTVVSFAPAQLIRRISRPAPPSELPCGSLSRPSPKVSIRPAGQPSVSLVMISLSPKRLSLRAALRQRSDPSFASAIPASLRESLPSYALPPENSVDSPVLS